LISSTRSSAGLGVVTLCLAGCAGAPRLPPAPAVELTAVPFFAQTEYQCGPAALATGAAVDADDLVDEVYVEELRGSLQPELLGATRRHGFIPYVIEPQPSALLAELAASRPVLVLQNLGVDRVPVWHYAVVVGIEGDQVILRSGTEQRRVEGGARFLRSWRRGSNWAFVALRPGELPASATPGPYVRALAAAELMLEQAAAERGYRAALERWPSDELVLFAAGAQRQAAGDYDDAEALYRRLLAAAPEHAVARNNLANLLAAQGCPAAALDEARAALASLTAGDALSRDDVGDFAAAIRDTVAELERTAPRGPDPPSCEAAGLGAP
jgi:hypothetical protein